VKDPIDIVVSTDNLIGIGARIPVARKCLHGFFLAGSKNLAKFLLCVFC
jgi:hypothetical protein